MALQIQHQQSAGELAIDKAYRVLEENLPSFERRPEQFELTVNITNSLLLQQHLVAEAPTGTGKSFAIFLAIIAAYHGTHKKAVIATANNNLLEQYANKDLPFLESMYPGLKWARAKGKGNYACIDKGEKQFGQQVLFNESDSKKRLQEWYDATGSGDREEITFKVPEAEWQSIAVDDSCTGRKCAYFKDCHYYKAKDKVQQAQIIVTNHDMVLIDLFQPMAQLFPTYDALFLDEAHQLEDKTISRLEQGLTQRQVENYLKKAERDYDVSDRNTLQSIDMPTLKLFTYYRGLTDTDRKAIEATNELRELTHDFMIAMDRLRAEVSRYKTSEGTREHKEKHNLMENITGAKNAAIAAVTNDERYVSWVEPTKTDIKVVTAPFRVSKRLHDALFSNPDITVITMSATLASGSKKQQFDASGNPVAVSQFETFRKRVGLTQTGEFICKSPFDYKRNCVLYLPDVPPEAIDPNKEEWRSWMCHQILDLVRLSNGRAFILTTSSKACRELGDYVAKMSGLPVKTQGPDMGNSKLIEWFKNTPNSVLVGTASFWEGVSIEGDDLKLVIIDKIPFTPHTDPIQQARQAWYDANPERKKRAFMDLQIYPAIIRLKQGFGRLIRTKTDTGAVALLDPRLTKKPYGKSILYALPNAARVGRLDDPRLIEILK